MSEKPVRVAVTQAEPAWLDLAEAVERTCRLIVVAAQGGAQLIAFPECWIPGYPIWIWARSIDPVLTIKYIKNSLQVDSAEMRTICACAAANSIVVSLGFSERYGSSVYIAQCMIDVSGSIRMRRRKLKPTHMERTLFGDASGSSLNNVVKLDIGKVGALSCWEHTQPLLKYHTYMQGEEIHVAGWPPLHAHPGGPALWSMSREGCQCQSQAYAIESAAFVLHSTAVVTEKGIHAMDTRSGALFHSAGGGASAVFAPDGRKITTDIPETEEGIIYADLDMNLVLASKSFLDVCGHYSRPDVLWLGVDRREKQQMLPQEGEEATP